MAEIPETTPFSEPIEATLNFIERLTDWRWPKWVKLFASLVIAVTIYVGVVFIPIRLINPGFDKTLPGWLKIFSITTNNISIFAYSGVVVWALLLLVTFWSYNANELSTAKRSLSEAIMRDLFKQQRRSYSGVLYAWFVRRFRTTTGNNAVAEFCELVGLEIDQNIATTEIAKHYKDGKKTATDYLCVINAHTGNSFLASVPEAFDYFSKYDREQNPRDRITRIFSVPIPLVQQAASKVPDWRSWKLSQRQSLFAALWVNKVAGVDTRLHLFCPNHPDNNFFEKADYVICFDPAESSLKKQKLVFLAQPFNEKICLRVGGSPELYYVFEREFYLRVTQGNEGHDNEMITLFTRDAYDDLLRTMGIDRAFAFEVLEKLRSHLTKFDPVVKKAWLSRIERWIRFNNRPMAGGGSTTKQFP